MHREAAGLRKARRAHGGGRRGARRPCSPPAALKVKPRGDKMSRAADMISFRAFPQKVIRTKVSRGRQVGRELSHGSWGAAVRPSAPLPLCAARLLWAISRALTRHQPQRTHPSREMRRVDTVCVVASFSHHVSNGENQVCPLLTTNLSLFWPTSTHTRVGWSPPVPIICGWFSHVDD